MNKSIRQMSFLFIAALLFSCGDDALDGGGGSGSATWVTTFNEQAGTLQVSTQAVVQEADGGVKFTATGLTSSLDAIFTLDVPGGASITASVEEPATMFVGGSGINANLDVDGVRYRATSGSFTLTSYGTAEGDTLAGSFDIGLVAFGSGEGAAATLQGDLTAVVATPTPTE